MDPITERDYQSAKLERTTFIYKEIDPEFIGREIYADDIDTPYSFYLVRKLTLGKDYQSLSEGEFFFDVLCDYWDASDEFEELFVKKIYLHVETQSMIYTLLLGSFEPTSRTIRNHLKQWVAAIQVESSKQPTGEHATATAGTVEVQRMTKYMLETSNELFRLRKMISELTTTVNRQMEEQHTFRERPVISRSIKTIHLKRAYPLLAAENNHQLAGDHAQKTSIEEQETKQNSASSSSKLATKTVGQAPISNSQPVKKRRFVYVNRKQEQVLLQPRTWAPFFNVMTKSPHRLMNEQDGVSKTIDEELEQQIYHSFVPASKRLGEKKKAMKKQRILRSELLNQISQAEYLPYSWGQVLRYTQEDLIISKRLSTSHLVAGLDEFLAELRPLVYSRSFFSKKVRCTEDTLKRLNGYLLLNQYMEKLAISYEKQEQRKPE